MRGCIDSLAKRFVSVLINGLLRSGRGASQGHLKASDVESIARVVDAQGRMIADSEFDARLRALEEGSSRLKRIDDGPFGLELVEKEKS